MLPTNRLPQWVGGSQPFSASTAEHTARREFLPEPWKCKLKHGTSREVSPFPDYGPSCFSHLSPCAAGTWSKGSCDQQRQKHRETGACGKTQTPNKLPKPLLYIQALYIFSHPFVRNGGCSILHLQRLLMAVLAKIKRSFCSQLCTST